MAVRSHLLSALGQFDIITGDDGDNTLTGTNNDGDAPRMSPVKSLGATPMIVKTCPFNRTVRPGT